MLFIFFIPYRLFEERKGEEEKRLKFKEDGQALKRDNVVRFCSFNLYFYFKFCIIDCLLAGLMLFELPRLDKESLTYLGSLSLKFIDIYGVLMLN